MSDRTRSPAKPARKTRRARLLALLLGLALSLALAELAATAWSLLVHGTASVAELHRREKGNTFVADSDEPYLKTLYPHPYLAFVHNKTWGGPHINDAGLYGGRNLPLERRPDVFTILVLGGSVAAQFAQLFSDKDRPLERILNERFDFGGRRVEVLNGAEGGWKHPHQIVMLALYGSGVDAAISIEGFNELLAISGSRIELPGNSFHQVNPLVTHGTEVLARASLSSRLHARSKQSWIIDHSRLVYLATAALRRGLVNWLTPLPDEAAQAGEISPESIFALPADWDERRRHDYGVESYRRYLRLADAMAGSLGLQRAFFLQPVPALHKQLSAEEEAKIPPAERTYGPRYAALVAELLRLRADEGLPVFSLLDVFADVKETIYDDHVHCLRVPPDWASTGYRMMAERIAATLESAWELRRRE